LGHNMAPAGVFACGGSRMFFSWGYVGGGSGWRGSRAGLGACSFGSLWAGWAVAVCPVWRFAFSALYFVDRSGVCSFFASGLCARVGGGSRGRGVGAILS